MEDLKHRSPLIRFGIFEVDVDARELSRQGLKVKLQEQPFQVLMRLLEHAGEVVTREDLQKELWPADTFVDFERGLNRAINKLREALGDDAESPRFIATLPRRGYRFLAPVEYPAGREVLGANASRIAIMPAYRERNVEASLPRAAVPARVVLPWAVAGVLAVVAVISFWRPLRGSARRLDQPFLQLELNVGPDEVSQPAISPDGMRIAFVSKGALAIRRLDQTNTTRLAGTEGGSSPFFSPNGHWVAFYAARKLQKISIEGGDPIALCDASAFRGGTWGSDDNIIAALDINSQEGVFRIPAAGGVPQSLIDSKSDPMGTSFYASPQVLPAGKGLLLASLQQGISVKNSLRVLNLSNGKLKTVVENASDGHYLESGYLVYTQEGELFGAPMDANRLELGGPAIHLASLVSFAEGRAEFDVSASGTLVYRPGLEIHPVLSWFYASGKVEPVLAKPGSYLDPRLSPDGTRLALSVMRDGKRNLWVYDLRRETWNRLTSEDNPESMPTWTLDGEFLAFRSGNTLAWTRSDGSGKVERLSGVSPNAAPYSFSPDGRWLAFWPLEFDSDLWTVPVERTPGALRLGRPQPLLQQPGSKGAPAISPDGRWVAYSSNAVGHFEIYVMPFSPGGPAGSKWLVSNQGGHSPRWSLNGRQLFYLGFDRRIQVAGYTAKGNSFEAEKPRLWSERQLADTDPFPGYDVALDGKRVVGLFASEEATPQTNLHLLFNVDSELRRSAPARRK